MQLIEFINLKKLEDTTIKITDLQSITVSYLDNDFNRL